MINKIFENRNGLPLDSENIGEYVQLYCTITEGWIYCFRRSNLFLLTLTKAAIDMC